MKTCHKCHRHLELNMFFRDKRRKDGYEGTCKDCRKGKVIIQHEVADLSDELIKAVENSAWEVMYSGHNRHYVCRVHNPSILVEGDSIEDVMRKAVLKLSEKKHQAVPKKLYPELE